MSNSDHTSRDTPNVVAPAIAGALAAVAVALLLHAQRLPLGVEGEWQWHVRPRPGPPSTVLVTGTAFVFVAAIAIFDACRRGRVARVKAWAALFLLAVGSYTSAVGAAASGPGGWLNATLAICSDLSFGYFSEAVHLTSAKEVRQWLREAHSRTRLGAVPSRVATHPPGPVIFVRWALQGLRRHQGITRVLSFPLRRHALSAKELEALAGSVSSAHPGASWILAATGLVWLLAIGAPLAVAGAFALGAACRDLRTGFLAAALTATIPALHIFMPGIDSWAAAISTWAMATAIWALKSRRVWAAGIAGLVWGVGLQWTFGLAALAPVMLWALWRWRWPRWWQAAAMLAAGLIAAHIPLVVLGYNPIDGFILSMRAQRAIMSERSYLSWIPLNAWDVILFMGPALVGLCTAAWGEDADLLLPVCATLVVLLLMGTTRGEVGRIWCFLMTPAAAAGACVLGRLRESALVLTGAVVVACQLAIAMVYVSYLALVTP